MLGKLLKYEIQATSRVFLPLYLGLLAVAVAASFTLQSNLDVLKGIIMFLLVMLYGALIVVTVVLLIQRFYRNLLKDEGYLMFTLPVHQATLVASKLVTACLWSILSTIVGAASGMIAGRSLIDINGIADAISQAVEFLAENSISPLLVLLAFSVGAAQFVQFVLQVYLSLAIGQLPSLSKHRVLSSIAVFIVASIAVQIIFTVALSGMVPSFMEFAVTANDGFEIAYGLSPAKTSQAVALTTEMLWIALIYNLALAAAMFFGTTWILKNKLNLE
ncbi:MAG: hypothetical protein FWG42_03930 [Clostridiales bacterium]|nr:hypothetical protein [Clostridiales bacterium]